MIKSVAEHRQILVDFLGGYLGILLCRGNVRMTCRTIISWWYKNKLTPDLSIVKRLGGSGGAKIRHLFGLCKDFEEKVCKVSANKQVYLFFAEPQPFLCKRCGNGGGLWPVHLCL